MSKLILILIFSLPLIFVTGCGRGTLGGAAIGAGAAGAAYEYSNKDALDDLEKDFSSGRISRDEYLRRKHDIERKSLLY
jgi:hypothetical protein